MVYPLSGRAPAQPAQEAHEVVLFAMATLAELRESDSESHLLRLRGYVRALAAQLQRQQAYAAVLDSAYIEALCACLPMYDMGSIGLPDRILLKPGRLTPEETAIMQSHTTLGFEAIARAEKTLGKHSPLLRLARELTLSHHEKWNGRGYPQGLRETQIPLSARIVALADVYDALISNKVYKRGLGHEAAVGVIFGERGAHFDPDIVDAFMEVSHEFRDVAVWHADTEQDMQRKIDYMANAITEVAVI